jgi:hypothetical protein
METWGSGGTRVAAVFSTSALGGGEWSVSRLGRFIPEVGPGSGLDSAEKRGMSCPFEKIFTQPL